MNEDDISREMYRAARETEGVDVLSWQGVSGKSYMTRDVRLRVGSVTMAPDLVLIEPGMLWIIEIKGTHTESCAEDEPKLSSLREQLTSSEIREQVGRRAGRRISEDHRVTLAVAYSVGRASIGCVPQVGHIPWEEVRPNMREALDAAH